MQIFKSFLVVVALMLLTSPTHAAVQWTQLTYKDGNPSGTPIRPNISCDGKYVYYIHGCRVDDCSGDQDEGSVYRVRVSNLSTTRVVSSAVGDDNKCIYVSADETGDTLAIDASDDLSGDTPPNSLGIEQIYIRNANGSISRLTAYESSYAGEGDGHKPNISCDGSTVCWTRDDTGFCCNTASCVTPTQIGTAGFMTSISPGNNGSTYVVMTTENLTGDPIPPIYDGSPQMYYFNGSTWERLGHFAGGSLEPRLSKDGLSVLFATNPENFGLADDSLTALKYVFATGMFSKLFEDSAFQGVDIASFASPDDNLSNVVVTSTANLAGTNTAQNDLQIYHGRVTQSDLTVQSGSPVNIEVTDPLGRTISKYDTDNIPGASYSEIDAEGDGICTPNLTPGDPNCQDRVVIDPRIPGDYTVKVIYDPVPTATPDLEATPEPGSTPTPFPTSTPDTYSLVVVYNDTAQILASHAPIPSPEATPEVLTIPPPEVPLVLTRGYVGAASQHLKIKGTFSAPEISGPITLSVSDGSQPPTVIDLGNTATYKHINSSVISTKIVNGLAKLSIRFKRPLYGDWQMNIQGKGFGLSQFAGADNRTILYSVSFGGSSYTTESEHTRNGKGDLVFRGK